MAKRIDAPLVAKLSHVLLMVLFSTISAQAQHLGDFENSQDIGNTGYKGSATYNAEHQTYTLTGSGANMWDKTDAFQYLWKSIQGDFILRARVKFKGEGKDPHRKVGWIVRNNLHADAAHVNASVHGDGLTSLQYRRSKGDLTEEVKSEDTFPDIIQLERRGNTFILSTARYGEPFVSVSKEVNLRNEVFAGIYICSHDNSVSETATFSNVRIIIPPKPEDVPYQDYLGSRLEIMDTYTGLRKILMVSAHSIQAPNWTPDGKTLIYNSNGYLYTYDLENGKVAMLNTGFANRNNNDHILHPDGSKIAISHHNDDDNGNSSIYYLPVEGSDIPVKVTKDGVGASYLHGWSSDGKRMLFTGNRDGQYDIVEIRVKDGKEKKLTDLPTLDDGSEYSPDGKWIYFNSARTGTMQLWRMKNNGKKPEQLTFDSFQDWFPHPDPTQERVVFISYPAEVPADEHPFYKHCLLREIPFKGGKPKILGYIFGGQGTINVPSWSPDSRYIAFVTNSN